VVIGVAHSYEWREVSIDPASEAAWAHPAVALTSDGDVLTVRADGSQLVKIAGDGEISFLPIAVTECHGIAPVASGGFWIADHGHKFVPAQPEYTGFFHDGAVARYSTEGQVELRLEAPDGEPWRPSGVAVHDFGRRSNASVWVADGYGRNVVHRFSAKGELLWSSDGSDSGTSFNTPHGIIVDTRSVTPMLQVADRGNRRIVSLDLDGHYVGEFGGDTLTSPSGFALDRNLLWVTELFGGLVAFGADDTVEEQLGLPLDTPDQPAGWPNAQGADGTVRPGLRPGRLHSPHGIACGPDGSLWVAEWLIGGRVSRLSRNP